MKTRVLILGLLLSISIYAFNEYPRGEIKFTITNKYLNNHSFITLLIKNKTETNYYLPIINSPESENRIFFFLRIICSDMFSKEFAWHSLIDTNQDKEEELLFKSWHKKKKSIDFKDFILLKSGDSTTIKVPMNLGIYISKNSFWEIKDYDNNSKINIAIVYHKKEAGVEDKLLSKNTIRKIKRMGYKLYTDEIISNNVTLAPNLDKSQIDTDQQRKTNDSADIKFQERIKKSIDIPKGSIQWKYYCYCTPNLSHLGRNKAYPLFKTEEFYSIQKCFRNIFIPEINEIIYRRLIEIARKNFKNKIYLYLVSGTGSVEFAEKQNENITDDNHLIYISVDDFIGSKEILKGVEIYNAETRKLFEKIKRK